MADILQSVEGLLGGEVGERLGKIAKVGIGALATQPTAVQPLAQVLDLGVNLKTPQMRRAELIKKTLAGDGSVLAPYAR